MDKVFHLVSKKTKIVNIRISRDYPDLHQNNRIKFVYENQPLGLLGAWMCRCKGWRCNPAMLVLNLQPDSIQGNHPESLRLTRYDPYPRLTRTGSPKRTVLPKHKTKLQPLILFRNRKKFNSQIPEAVQSFLPSGKDKFKTASQTFLPLPGRKTKLAKPKP